MGNQFLAAIAIGIAIIGGFKMNKKIEALETRVAYAENSARTAYVKIEELQSQVDDLQFELEYR